MKKLLILAIMAALLSSCAVHRASVISTSSATPMKTTTTVASLNVAKERISYTYVPSRSDAKRLSETQLIDNAMYLALQENGNADVLVKVNFYVTKRTGFLARKIKSISVSGYPARYVDFRQPSDADYTNFERLPQDAITDVHAKTSMLKRLFGPRKERKLR